MSKTIGIDLGTTYSSVSIISDNGQPQIIKNGLGENLTPSVIYFDENGGILVGSEAKEMQAFGEANIASFFKRNMGNKDYLIPFNGKDYSATELSSILLQKLKIDAEVALGHKVSQAVITVPAYFDDFQRKETIKAAQIAGLTVLRIINEPTAAALAYGFNKIGEQKLLVYDLGGGTFDVTVLNINNGHFKVLATGGDHELGGKDWDDRIYSYITSKFEDEFYEIITDNSELINDLLIKSENVKKQLSVSQSARVSIVYDGNKGVYEVTREKFEEITQDLLQSTTLKAEQVLKESNLSWNQLDGVLLVGGSTRMPMITEWVEKMSGKPAIGGINVDEAVCFGAAIQAGIETGCPNGRSRFSIGSKIKVDDVMSHSLGLIAIDYDQKKYINSILLKRNQTIPCLNNKEYDVRRNRNGKDELEIYLLQGENKQNPNDNNCLGRYVITGFRFDSAEHKKVKISFSYDANGIVVVSGQQVDKGIKLNIEHHEDYNLAWLSEPINHKKESKRVPYTKWKGQNTISGAKRDKYGNAEGSEFDLARDGAFKGLKIAILHLYTGEGFDFKLPQEALEKKGFEIIRWKNTPPSERQFAKELEKACQLWVISDSSSKLNVKYIKIIKDFFFSGRGIYLWGDNDPYHADANSIASDIFSCSMAGNYRGDQVIGIQEEAGVTGLIPNHPITTGLENIYEGITIASIYRLNDMKPLIYDSSNMVVASYHDENGRRAIMDGGFTRLYYKWDSAGTARYIVNAAAWLANFERFGEDLFE